MNLSLNKFLIFLLILIVIGLFYTGKPHTQNPNLLNSTASDAEQCAKLQDPSLLPFVSYNTKEGFNECVSRCITSAMRQVCSQLPENSNVFATHPELKQQMLDGCTQNIKHFITDNIRCPFVNCEP